METTKFNQTFYQAEADELFPAGCKCTSTNGGGDCDWCQVYYNGPEMCRCPYAKDQSQEWHVAGSLGCKNKTGEAHGGTDTE